NGARRAPCCQAIERSIGTGEPPSLANKDTKSAGENMKSVGPRPDAPTRLTKIDKCFLNADPLLMAMLACGEASPHGKSSSVASIVS
ncbi:hypothetical protein, partial [Burkholderia humptydooensis]|uniref:hypothetical protein n=1 Tax=Burkholderia humptydooensis TaxID=430531 RepID=UPI001E31FDB8